MQTNFEIQKSESMEAFLVSSRTEGSISYFTFHFKWTETDAEKDASFLIRWEIPMVGILYYWSPLCGYRRNVAANWMSEHSSMISAGAPLESLYDGENVNRYTWQISECQKLVFFHSGIMEENGNIECRFRFGTKQFTGVYETEITLRVDETPQPLYETLKNAAKWWAEDLGMVPAFVPNEATEPCYSFWYSYHQEVYEKEVEDECRRAHALGFHTCIIDDGWQTDDNSRGYAFCGDWEVAPDKIKDMKAHVARVHEIGMKYILWYSVPLLGFRSKHYKEFQDMVLNNSLAHLNACVLDPRYQKVRDFLIGIYVRALTEWDLDGFKLDFIDTWRYDPANAPYNDKMDIPSLENAVQTFMFELNAALKKIKPDIMLEFRQGYIGPHMRTFGNMFRVGDCPDDYISNRVGSLDLRMTMGESAVHSDMLTWHKDEKPEIAALQFASVLFSVVQYSARLDRLTPDMKKMSLHYLDFLREHKETLLKGELHTYEPHLLYTWAEAVGKEETIAAVYAMDKCVKPVSNDSIYLVNGCEGKRILAELEGRFTITTCNALGETISHESRELAGVSALPCPVGGMILLKKM